jgi:hypothetical protein
VTLAPAFPLGTTFLPGDAVVLRVFELRYLELLHDALEKDQTFVTALIAAGSEVGGGDKRFDSGVLVEIDHVDEAEVGLMLYGHATAPVNIKYWNDERSYPQAKFEIQFPTIGTDSFSDCSTALSSFAIELDQFFSFLDGMKIPTPAPPGFVRSLVPSIGAPMTAETHTDLFWALARLLPCTAMARFELLVDQSLIDRIQRAVAEIQHMREIVTFRHSN